MGAWRCVFRSGHLLSTNTRVQRVPGIIKTSRRSSTSFARMAWPRTELVFQRDGDQLTLSTTIAAIESFSSLSESNRALFKAGNDATSVLVCPATVFHPQGGGQPSDVGCIKAVSGDTEFNVQFARSDAEGHGTVLHFGTYKTPNTSFQPGDAVTQHVDPEKRLLYSRLHTAGHVLGSAVRHLLEHEIEGFDELKASHFPDSAACEFAGLIPGEKKAPIQEKVDAFVAQGMPVEIDFWDEADFERHGVARLIPDRAAMGMGPNEKFRVVKIVGAEVYPCGGTHVHDTRGCGKVTVRKVGRSKGTSRVSYSVA